MNEMLVTGFFGGLCLAGLLILGLLFLRLRKARSGADSGDE